MSCDSHSAIAEKAKVIDVCLFLLDFWQRCAGCIFITNCSMTVIFDYTFVSFPLAVPVLSRLSTKCKKLLIFHSLSD